MLGFALNEKKYHLIDGLLNNGYDVNTKENESPLEIASGIKRKRNRKRFEKTWCRVIRFIGCFCQSSYSVEKFKSPDRDSLK